MQAVTRKAQVQLGQDTVVDVTLSVAGVDGDRHGRRAEVPLIDKDSAAIDERRLLRDDPGAARSARTTATCRS